MSKGEGQSEAGNPDVFVAASVVALDGSSHRQPPHRREGVSGVLWVGIAEVLAIEAEAVALGVAVGDSMLVVEALVATEPVLEVVTAIIMIVGDTVIEVDLAAIGGGGGGFRGGFNSGGDGGLRGGFRGGRDDHVGSGGFRWVDISFIFLDSNRFQRWTWWWHWIPREWRFQRQSVKRLWLSIRFKWVWCSSHGGVSWGRVWK